MSIVSGEPDWDEVALNNGSEWSNPIDGRIDRWPDPTLPTRLIRVQVGGQCQIVSARGPAWPTERAVIADPSIFPVLEYGH